MLHHLDPSIRTIFRGNLLLIVCCIFYLAWWILAFRPVGAVKGLKTGWLLIPAFAAGMAALKFIIEGIGELAEGGTLFPIKWVLGTGIFGYFLLLAVTLLVFKRPVTTELILIVGWTVLTICQVDVLYGSGCFSWRTTVIFLLVIGLAALIDLVCYVLYYNLDNYAGYFDGMVPLALAALIMACICGVIV